MCWFLFVYYIFFPLDDLEKKNMWNIYVEIGFIFIRIYEIFIYLIFDWIDTYMNII